MVVILNKFGEYHNTLRLKANQRETKNYEFFFQGYAFPENLTFTLNGSNLDIANEFDYLGILFNGKGKFNKTIQKPTENV